MGPLKNEKHERFAQLVASGMSMTGAYREVGYSNSNSGSAKLARRPEVAARIKTLFRMVSLRTAAAVSRNISKSIPLGGSYPPPAERPINPRNVQVMPLVEVSREGVARELACLGFSNMADFISIDEETKQPVVRLDGLSRQQLAAVKKLKIVERGVGDRRTRTFEFELYNKSESLMNLARIMGWIIEREDRDNYEKRFMKMTPDERAADARRLAAQIRERLDAAAAAGNVTDLVEDVDPAGSAEPATSEYDRPPWEDEPETPENEASPDDEPSDE